MKPVLARLVVLVTTLLATPALAQEKPDASKRAMLDQMLSALRAAPSEDVADALEQRIRQAWLEGGSPAVTLLMGRGLRELQAGANDEAQQDFDAALALDPDLAAAYNQRAVARFQQGDITGAIRDIEETLRHEPRDFAALQSLSRIAESRKDWAGAYAAWQQVMAIDPKTPGGEARLQDLRRRALGEAT
jgi:tetratricopeptide (TPR) repeat protein